ncbi:MAG: phosphoglycerate dehydrogenase [Clostridia bacterium]|nr:phosphoglycerate dehydrogenase [Clostridia bacterium]
MRPDLVICVGKPEALDCSEILRPLTELGFAVIWKNLSHTQDERSVIECVKGYSYVIAGSEVWNRAVFESVRGSLKMLIRFGAGLDSVDTESAAQFGIPVSNVPGRNAKAVAEHVLAMMLCLTRQISKYDSQMKNGIWNTVLTKSLTGTVGLIGFGAVAKQLAGMLRCFPVEVLAFDVIKNETDAGTYGIRFAALDEIIEKSDFISIHVPLTDVTRGMVNEDFLGRMKSTAYLINTSRGRIIDEAAIIHALQAEIIAGAGLDVFEEEPLPTSSPLLKLDNILLTPHAASASDEGFRSVLSGCVDKILDHFNSNFTRQQH